jgi:cold shock CspA family protein
VQGAVATFDEARGLGEIDVDGARFPFHCTALVDGTREVAVGTTVTFEVRPGGMGRWEATRIVKVAQT